jgi:hypothetical protein
MSEPVIIDDGGSTRIRQTIAGQDMDGLLSVPAESVAAGNFGQAGAARCNLKVMHYKKDASHHGQNTTIPLSGGNSVEIVSENQQSVIVALNNADATLRICLQSLTGGVVPVVEASNDNGQRRYVVRNAGSISKVTVNPGANVVFDSGSLPPDLRSIHTAVFFID